MQAHQPLITAIGLHLGNLPIKPGNDLCMLGVFRLTRICRLFSLNGLGKNSTALRTRGDSRDR
jgi:hypothetical protein